MDERVAVALTVNGAARQMFVEPRKTLADALREDLALTGTHLGCEHGVCGACTVLLDGEAVRSCLMFAVQAEGAEVVTVEGLAAGAGAAQRRAAGDARVPRPAVRVLHAGLRRLDHRAAGARPDPDDDEIRDGLSGNLCRCTGYQGIVAAVKMAAGARQEVSLMTALDEHAPSTAGNRFVGQRVQRREDARLVTGHGTYVDDVVVPGMLHIAFLRCDIACGTITEPRRRRRRASCPASSPCSPVPTSTARSARPGSTSKVATAAARSGRWPRATCASPARPWPSSSPSRATSPRTPAT